MTLASFSPYTTTLAHTYKHIHPHPHTHTHTHTSFTSLHNSQHIFFFFSLLLLWQNSRLSQLTTLTTFTTFRGGLNNRRRNGKKYAHAITDHRHHRPHQPSSLPLPRVYWVIADVFNVPHPHLIYYLLLVLLLLLLLCLFFPFFASSMQSTNGRLLLLLLLLFNFSWHSLSPDWITLGDWINWMDASCNCTWHDTSSITVHLWCLLSPFFFFFFSLSLLLLNLLSSSSLFASHLLTSLPCLLTKN